MEEAYNQEKGIVQHINTFRTHRGSTDFDYSFTQEWPVGGLTHQLSYDIPVISSSDGHTIGFKATEKFVPVEGNLFVLGKIEGSTLVKPGWRSMMASNKGRDGLLASVAKKKKFSFIGGGVAAVASIPAIIFAPKPDPNDQGSYCASVMQDSRARCSDNVSTKDGDDHDWTVTKAGKYELTVFAPKKKIPFAPGIKVVDSGGKVVGDGQAGMEQNAVTTVDVAAGAYKVVVYPSDGYMVDKGGFTYEMEIKSLGGGEAPPAAAVDPGLPAEDGVKEKEDVAAAPKEEAAPPPAAKTKAAPKKKGKK